MLEANIAHHSGHIHRVVPSGLFEITLYYGDVPESVDSKRLTNKNSQITGQLKDYFDIKVYGKLFLFSVYFYPEGLSMFLDLPLNELFNQVIPLRYLLKDETDCFEEELQNAQSFENKVAIAEKFLINRLKKNKKRYEFPRINHGIRLINKTRGQVDIDRLASECCLSRRQFERIFSNIIGTTPKQFLKIVRFQKAVHDKSVNPEVSLTNLAYSCGFYDQSHMISDFTSLSGLTPKQYFNSGEPISDYFQ
jgi:AraC-like DNA-binding protein